MLNKGLSRARLGHAVASVAFCITAIAAAASADAQTADPVVFSFATVGDSRQDLKSPDPTTLLPNNTGTLLPQDKEFLQNTLAFQMILNGINAQNPNLLFFNGDMIYGYGRPILPTGWASGQPNSWTTTQTVSPDTVFEYVQYAYWRGMVANLFINGTYVIPVPGNHESQCSNTAAPYSSSNLNPNCAGTSAGAKTAYADNENAFRANVGDLISDLVTNTRFSNVSGFNATSVNGLTATSAPVASTNNGPITGNQAELSYSFDISTGPGIIHFAVINTDPSGADATAPADWLASDLSAAQGRGAIKYFVFGHKPAFTYNYSAASGGTVAAGGLDANTNINLRNSFWSVIAQYGATYFCGHEHTVNVAQYADPTGTYPGTPYQVIVGSGGSPFDDKLVGTCPNCSEPVVTNFSDRYYAWALVEIHQSGAVSINVQGFNDSFGSTVTIYTNPALQ